MTVGTGGEKIPTGAAISQERIAEAQAKEALEEEIELKEAEVTIGEELEEMGNPLEAGRQEEDKQTIKDRRERGRVAVSEKERLRESQKIVVPEKEIQEQSKNAARSDKELREESLKTLLDRITNCRNKEEILEVVKSFYSDATLAMKAFDFLLATTLGPLRVMVQEAKDEFAQVNEAQLRAAENVSKALIESAIKSGLPATPSSLRGQYWHVLTTYQDAASMLFDFLDQYDLKQVLLFLSFLDDAIGRDLKKGPSIDPVFLMRLRNVVQYLQSTHGVIHTSEKNVKLMKRLFKAEELSFPKELNSKAMCRAFLALVRERYPTKEKVREIGSMLRKGEKTG